MVVYPTLCAFVPGILIGVILVVQGRRGAGKAITVLGAASIVLALYVLMLNLGLLSWGVRLLIVAALGLCGVVAIVLAFREGRRQQE